MPSTSHVFLLSVTMLAALALYVTGSPVVDAPSDPTSGETSGDALDAELSSDSLGLSPLWKPIIAATEHHEKQFEDEFLGEVKYHFLDNYKIPAPQRGCPRINSSKESCVQRVAQGLHKNMVLLKHVEKEYPDNSITRTTKYYGGILIQRFKEEMKHPERVVELTTSEQERLLKELDNPDTFQRKMIAHNILRQLHWFLIDGKRAIVRKEMQMERRKGHNN